MNAIAQMYHGGCGPQRSGMDALPRRRAIPALARVRPQAKPSRHVPVDMIMSSCKIKINERKNKYKGESHADAWRDSFDAIASFSHCCYT
ncbi:unnamed protein product [Euphydryas editha]|uniref:Uncharacterized protein n=1 Tax=Euphydryas editha TaxID=104508 RepID=A0AAU9U316_EUPED|nr:unnamed protein product [Euphydryas editha]